MSSRIKDSPGPERGQRSGPIGDLTLVPAELKARPQWVVWRYITRDGKRTKLPLQARTVVVKKNGRRPEASSTDPATWSTFEQAVNAFDLATDRLDGIGFVFSEDDPYAGVDLDNCLKDGEVLEWAARILGDLMPSYAEVSPSGNGIKVWVKGRIDGSGTRKNGFGDDKAGCVEVYDRGRYFAVTGNSIDAARTTIADRAEAVARIYGQVKPAKASPAPAQPPPSAPLDLSDSELVEKARKARNGGKFSALYDRGDTSGYAGDDSSADFALCKLIAYWTGPDPARVERVFRSSALYREKWDERRGDSTYGLVTIANALEGMAQFYAPRKRGRPVDKGPTPPAGPEAPEAPVEPKRPEIEINTQRHMATAAAVEALCADPDLYSRAGSLVSVVREKDDELKLTGRTRLRNAAGSPKIVDLSEAIIGNRLTKHAVFYQWKKNRAGEDLAVDVHPPDWLIRSVATLKQWDGIRPLHAVVECPFPRADGSIVETPGYDAETATLYAPSIRFPKVPDRPTQADAQAGWARIVAHFKDFPFGSEDDRVVVLAGILTVIARPAIDGPVPGIAVIGNKAGTGKGLLIDGMSMPGIGRPAPTSAYPEDKEEAVKVKVAIAMAARSVVHFDNLEEGSMYGNGALDSALTAPTVDDRVLGASKLVGELQLRASWFLSGNNINPCKDAYRRWLVCNLITELEHPERRDDLGEQSFRSIMQTNRGEIVRDALTILRAHAITGRPGAGWGPLGSFEEWDRMIRRAVWFATDRDCLTTQRRTAEDSQDRQDKLALLQGWLDLPGGDTGLTTNEAAAIVEDNPARFPTLHGVMLRLGQAGKPMTARALGNRFRGLKNNRIAGLMLKQAGEKHNTALWAVESHREDTIDNGLEGPSERGIWGSGGCHQDPNAEALHSHSDTITNTKECEAHGDRCQQHPPDPQIPPRVTTDPDDWTADPNFNWGPVP